MKTDGPPQCAVPGVGLSRAFLHSAACRFAVAGAFVFLAGCGNQYRPVVTATNPVGPAGQPTKYAVAISSPSASSPGLVNFIDFSGDTVLSTPSIQNNPTYIALTTSGGVGYTINALGVFDEFGTGNPSSLLTSNIITTTLQSGSAPITISPYTVSGTAATVFVPEAGSSSIAGLNQSGQLLQNVAVPAGPVYVVGADGTARVYALSNNGGVGAGTASAIESSANASLSVSASIPVGTNPVYGVMTSDTKRAFILNKGSQNVSVINAVNNALDTAVPTISIPTVLDSGGHNLSANPIWADLSPLTTELAVLSAGDGTHSGLLTIINIPLCSAAALPTNPNCSTTNPVDATGFGTIVAQVPVGINPTIVSVLRDGTRAYVANSGTATTSGSVTVVNLTSGVATTTLPTIADTTALSTPSVFGLHPSTIVATTGNPTGKVYVTSSDSHYLTVIYTDTDTVNTHIPLQGLGVKVVITQP
jgi:DNA-binding beta-propeller fold protein YncE